MPHKDPEKQRAANRASHAKRVAADPDYSRRKSAKWDAANPEKRQAIDARYKKGHPPTDEDRIAKRIYNAQYYEKGGEALRAKQRVYQSNAYARNPEKSQAATRRWAESHPEKGAERQARRRARKKNAGVCESVERLVV